jgi:hypothetical protein
VPDIDIDIARTVWIVSHAVELAKGTGARIALLRVVMLVSLAKA